MKIQTFRALSFAATTAFAVFALPACAAQADDTTDGEETESTAEALSACGTAKYNTALAHYKTAVAWSKDRLAQGVCRSENGYLWSIADEAAEAVLVCGEFKDVIRTSVWAAPLRKVLAPSLTLQALEGDLLVLRDSSWQNWTGTERLFQAGGLTFWARAEGAYGPAYRVDFKANGKATWNYLEENPSTFEITMKAQNATFRIERTTEAAKRTIVVTHGTKTERYELGVQNPSSANGAPIFVLTPRSGSATPAPLFSLVSECDA